MQVSHALRTAVRGISSLPQVVTLRYILPDFNSLYEKITGPDETELSHDESAVLRFVFTQVMHGTKGTELSARQVIGLIFYRVDGEGTPMNASEIQVLAKLAWDIEPRKTFTDAKAFMAGWISRHFINLEDLLEMPKD